jgi:hypothetical protein
MANGQVTPCPDEQDDSESRRLRLRSLASFLFRGDLAA